MRIQVILLSLFVCPLVLIGQEWRPLPNDTAILSDVNGFNALEIFNEDLIIGGTIYEVNGEVANGLVRWDSTAFHWMGGEVVGAIEDIEVYDNNLFVVGSLNFDTDEDYEDILIWDQNSYTGVGVFNENTSGMIAACQVFEGKLFVSDDFDMLAGLPLWAIACWDGEQWSDPGGVGGFCAEEFVVYNDTLLSGGIFWSNDDGTPVSHLVYWDQDTTWLDFHGGLNSQVKDMVSDTTNNSLYVCGQFNHAGDPQIPSQGVVKWTGTEWQSMCNYDSFEGGQITSLCMYRDQLYMSGFFDYILHDGDTLHWRGIMYHDGAEWHEVGGGMDGGGMEMLVYKDGLYIAGTISSVGSDSIPVNNIVRWYMHPDSVQWGVSIDEPMSHGENKLLIYPNPNEGRFTVRFEKAVQGSLLVTCLRGRQKLYEPIRGRRELQVDLSMHPPGVYLVSLMENGVIAETQKVVMD